MRSVFQKPVKLSTLAKALNLPFKGEDIELCQVAPISHAEDGSLSFLTKDREMLFPKLGVIAFQSFSKESVSRILAPNPRLTFARALHWLEKNRYFNEYTHDAKIHPSVKIGQFVSIGKNVEIGEETVILPNVVIHDGVKIGKRCMIKSGTVIGQDGFGFERDENQVPFRIPHVGTVVIGDDVEIGSLNTVCRGTLRDTVIGNNVKIDDHVHVAHNVQIGAKTYVIACAELSGGVIIGEEAWISPQSSIKEQLKIGKGAMVGLGAVVLKDVPEYKTVVGNPARILEKK